MHGGRVSAESEGRGLGAAFTVELPLESTEGDRSTTGDLPAIGAPDDPLGSLSAARVLVVDDNPDSIDIVVELLERAGARISSASSASAALRLLRRRPFDLLLCDVGMPRKSGLDLIRELRAGDGPNRDIPAAALTAYAREEDRQRVLAAGFDEHIAKPLEVSRALATMSRLLATGRSSAQPNRGTITER